MKFHSCFKLFCMLWKLKNPTPLEAKLLYDSVRLYPKEIEYIMNRKCILALIQNFHDNFRHIVPVCNQNTKQEWIRLIEAKLFKSIHKIYVQKKEKGIFTKPLYENISFSILVL